MRNKKRIPKALKEIKKIWEKNPDLRLGQLLINVTHFTGPIYYVEDEDLIESLKEFYGEK